MTIHVPPLFPDVALEPVIIRPSLADQAILYGGQRVTIDQCKIENFQISLRCPRKASRETDRLPHRSCSIVGHSPYPESRPRHRTEQKRDGAARKIQFHIWPYTWLDIRLVIRRKIFAQHLAGYLARCRAPEPEGAFKVNIWISSCLCFPALLIALGHIYLVGKAALPSQ